jgi:hypothetical protein
VKTTFLLSLFIIGTLVTAMPQTGNRFPTPLGIDRVLTGVVEKANPSAQNANSRRYRYQLHIDSDVYALHGQETKLKKLVGKQVRIVGHVVGNDVDVRLIEGIKEN